MELLDFMELYLNTSRDVQETIEAILTENQSQPECSDQPHGTDHKA